MRRTWERLERRTLSAARVGAACVVLAAAWGCEDGDDYDHTPPSGQGSLVIENLTSDDIDLFIDGAYHSEVGDGHHRTVDLDPGLYRVVLNEDGDGVRNFRGDVDILSGRLTILDVAFGSAGSSEYDVRTRFD